MNNQKGINWRDTLYLEAKKVKWNPSKIKKKVDTSCTPMCLIAFNAAGINMSSKIRAKYTCEATGTYRGMYKSRTVNAESLVDAVKLVNKEYRKKGKPAPFKIIKMNHAQFKVYKKNLKRGDVISNYSHTAMVL